MRTTAELRKSAIFAVALATHLCVFTALLPAQDADRNFSGRWQLNQARSDIRSHFDIPDQFLRVTQTDSTMTVATSAREGDAPTGITYPLSGKPLKSQSGGFTFNIATKFEGSALLANVIVGGQVDYVLSERWSKSRDGSRLTVERTLENKGSQVDSTLVYDNLDIPPPPQVSERRVQPEPAAPTRPQVQALARREPPVQANPTEYVLAAGTRILLRLTNAVNTKHTAAGDHIYLQTAVPLFQNGRVVIPQGSYVTGEITESQRAGRVKGKSELNLRFDSLTLPNGVVRDFRSRAGSVDTAGNLDRTEGRITGEGSKGKDAGTVASTTAAGAGIGSIAGAAAGSLGMGAGIGAAAGAAAGLARVFGSRGQDVVVPAGTSMEMVLDRELRYTDAELGRIQ
jgi:hypothetical protein